MMKSHIFLLCVIASAVVYASADCGVIDLCVDPVGQLKAVSESESTCYRRDMCSNKIHPSTISNAMKLQSLDLDLLSDSFGSMQDEISDATMFGLLSCVRIQSGSTLQDLTQSVSNSELSDRINVVDGYMDCGPTIDNSTFVDIAFKADSPASFVSINTLIKQAAISLSDATQLQTAYKLLSPATPLSASAKYLVTDGIEILYPNAVTITPWRMFGINSDTSTYGQAESACKQRTTPDTTIVDTTNPNPGGYNDGTIRVNLAGPDSTYYANTTTFLFPHCTWGQDLTTGNIDTWAIAWFDLCGTPFSVDPSLNPVEGGRQNSVVSDQSLVIGPVTSARLSSCPGDTVSTVLHRCVYYHSLDSPLTNDITAPLTSVATGTEIMEGRKWLCTSNPFSFTRAQAALPTLDTVVNAGDFGPDNGLQVFEAPQQSKGTLRINSCPDLVDEVVHGNQVAAFIHNANKPSFEASVVDDDVQCVRYPGADFHLNWRFKTSFEILDTNLISALEDYQKFYVPKVTGVYVSSVTTDDGTTDLTTAGQCVDFKMFVSNEGCKLNVDDLNIAEHNVLKEEDIADQADLIDKAKFVITGHVKESHVSDVVSITDSPIISVGVKVVTSFTPHFIDENGQQLEFKSEGGGSGGGRRLRSVRRLQAATTLTFNPSEDSDKLEMYKAYVYRAHATITGGPAEGVSLFQWVDKEFTRKMQHPVILAGDKPLYYAIEVKDAKHDEKNKKVYVDFDLVFEASVEGTVTKISLAKADDKITFTDTSAQGQWALSQEDAVAALQHVIKEDDDSMSTVSIVLIVVGVCALVLVPLAVYFVRKTGNAGAVFPKASKYSPVPVLGPASF